MASRGNLVHVFCATKNILYKKKEHHGCLIHLIPAENNQQFRKNVVPFFSKYHDDVQFDICESPEYGADGIEIKKLFPKLPFTLKLHTPSFLVWELNDFRSSIIDRFRFIFGSIIRFQKIRFYWKYNKLTDLEYELYEISDSVSSPSKSLSKIVQKKWGSKKINILPYPFIPHVSFISKKIPALETIIVTFIGKLEKRKGIVELMNAIPEVLQVYPRTIFRFVGKSSPSPIANMDMEMYIKTKLRLNGNNLKFFGFQPYEKIPEILNESHICIFPSLWENFPNVCLEAMSMGKAVIGTNNGGIADMIQHQKNGILIAPKSKNEIVKSLVNLIGNRPLQLKLGNEAKQSIEKNYGKDSIGKLTEDFYHQTIKFLND